MFPFFRKPHPPPPKWGLREVTTKPGIVYHAEGRLRNTRAFLHAIAIRPRSAVAIKSVGVDWINFVQEATPKLIQAEARVDIRRVFPEIFLSPPNFILTITTTPNVGDRRELFVAPVRFDRYPYVSAELAKRVGQYLRITLEGLGENITDKKFMLVSPLERLIIADAVTAQFWMLAIARAYLDSVKPRN